MIDFLDASLCYLTLAIIGTVVVCAVWAVGTIWRRGTRVGLSEADVALLLGYKPLDVWGDTVAECRRR